MLKLHPISLAVLALFTSLAAHADDIRRPYIVQLADQPVASYSGGVTGLNATQPAKGKRLDLASDDVQRYAGYLDGKRAEVQAIIAQAPVQYQYSVVLNGFAALLTDAEVRQLKASGAVASIAADAANHLDTNYTPTFLGLDQPNGLWSQLGGATGAGEDIIIGIVDGGVWPENPSYADRVDAGGAPSFAADATLAYGPAPARWQGTCQTGEGFSQNHCNNKLIGAQFFNATRLTDTARVPHWSEFVSPRDSIGSFNGQGGHGTHTSSTAGGNRGVQASIDGNPLGAVSGMAPRARLAVYKTCWSYNDASDPTGAKNTCYGSDSVAAIEKAVKDGVNVINYSISGGTNVGDPVEQAFLHAANAGVFVAASGGNAGPANSVAHISPWLTTVAASTHDRTGQGSVTLANGRRYTGASMTGRAAADSPLIRAEDAGLAGADAGKLALCFSATGNGGVALLDPAKVSGKIVTCTRGSNARTDKGQAVKDAGGAGMVLVDNGAGLEADAHVLPAVHVSKEDGALIRAYAQTAGAAGSIAKFAPVKGAVLAPVVADFSSRGPNRYDPNTLKPDVAAPGVAILAGLTPPLSREQQAEVINGTLVPAPFWGLYQGTSMASPHVAGLAALLRQLHPDWSPAAIKSALMTTGSTTYADAQSGDLRGTLSFGQGAGHVTPNRAADPGLVYDIAKADYKKYMCGLGLTAECAAGSMAAYNLNLPSITVSNVLGAQKISRQVTNVGGAAATYTATASISGYSVSVEPASLTLEAGETKSFELTLTRGNAAANVWQYGALVWSDGVHTVRSPITARSGRSVIAPELVRAEKASGSRLLTLNTGFTGRLAATTGGLKAVTRSALNVAQAVPETVNTAANATAACKAGISGVRVVSMAVPANTIAARFETFDRDTEGGQGHDLDLLVLDGAGALVGASQRDGSNESVLLASPAGGTYKVCVIGYAAANGVSTDFTLSSVIVGKGDAGGNLKVSLPSKVYAASSTTAVLSWSGLAAEQRYLGGVQFVDPSGALAATTVISVETDNPLPLADMPTRAPKRDSRL
ncbi:S8 family serine peptidase [Janthinobacterium sp.]|uniref:S8 family serine peptidase n=1 Tax=Janthinobacterium sp. TaxID=1871054 RepID=UPI00293D761C|nr:S8 family serine peptidase [Janthinobacterium sp.]